MIDTSKCRLELEPFTGTWNRPSEAMLARLLLSLFHSRFFCTLRKRALYERKFLHRFHRPNCKKANLPHHFLADLGFILGLHRDDTTTVLLTTFMTWTLEG